MLFDAWFVRENQMMIYECMKCHHCSQFRYTTMCITQLFLYVVGYSHACMPVSGFSLLDLSHGRCDRFYLHQQQQASLSQPFNRILYILRNLKHRPRCQHLVCNIDFIIQHFSWYYAVRFSVVFIFSPCLDLTSLSKAALLAWYITDFPGPVIYRISHINMLQCVFFVVFLCEVYSLLLFVHYQ